MRDVNATRRRPRGLESLTALGLAIVLLAGSGARLAANDASSAWVPADEPAVERLLALTQLAWDYCWRTNPARRFAPMGEMLGAFQRRSYRHYDESTFAREFVPSPGVPTTPHASIYQLDDPWVAVVELSDERQTIRITVVDFSGEPGGTHYAVWRYSYATPRPGPNGGEVGGTASLEGHIRGLDTRTSGSGTYYYDRISKQPRHRATETHYGSSTY